MAWKTITLELSDTWIEALEKYAKDNGLKDIEEASVHAIILFLQNRDYLA
jgi:hypothetical protein